MKSKTKIDEQSLRKSNPDLVETIRIAKKNEGWLGVAGALSGSRRNKSSINLDKINQESKEGDKIIVPGKVLSVGNISKKIKVSALNFSESAKQKLKEAKVDFNFIIEEIKSNPSAEGIKVLK
jgi:large subunit ribosomal protein L18e